MNPKESLLYWIRERYSIYLLKEVGGKQKPWSSDPVFQHTYFCNVHRENDKVTRWIRDFYSPHVGDDMFEYNIILSRFLNWPATLELIGYKEKHDPKQLLADLIMLSTTGKVWGNAYVITTHGIKMPKAQYLCENVLEGVYKALPSLRNACRGQYCGVASRALQELEGIGTFLAGQVVADLKHTQGHPLKDSYDYTSFVVPGPGSIRGLAWWLRGTPEKARESEFREWFPLLREQVDAHWPAGVPYVDNQDLQNCLCEFDKYMRVKTGSGRSKRGYNGS